MTKEILTADEIMEIEARLLVENQSQQRHPSVQPVPHLLQLASSNPIKEQEHKPV